MPKNPVLVTIVDDRKWVLTEELSLEAIIAQEPCTEILVKAIKMIPEKVLFASIDPKDCNCDICERRYNRIMNNIASLKRNVGNDIIDFLETCGIIYEDVLTIEEEKRIKRNKKRRLERVRAKKQTKSK